ncbi:hypothetical protein [Luedemannella helvata]|uniref:Uncharacterized protein n=1 Tax=Luedemannella helvata TaxID=349315 RepID=A0ABP4X5Y4_9ACTN
MADFHATVVHELLVRYLDAWTARALHGARAVAYAQLSATGDDAAGAALAAVRVFAEFADRARGQAMTVRVACPDDATAGRVRAALAAEAPADVTIDVSARSQPVLDDNANVFAYLDHRGEEPPTAATLAALGERRGLEVLVRGPAVALDAWAWWASVDLVDRTGSVETVSFGAGDERALTVFKDELWALDEYAGIRYVDPGDPERTPLDISLRPALGPLRRAVCARLGEGPLTLGALRTWALGATIYRADDVTRAATELHHNGTVRRDPPGGRLTLATVLSLA